MRFRSERLSRNEILAKSLTDLKTLISLVVNHVQIHLILLMPLAPASPIQRVCWTIGNILGSEVCKDCFVPAAESDGCWVMELFETYRRQRVKQHDTLNRGLNVRQREEAALANIHDVVDLGIKLHVYED